MDWGLIVLAANALLLIGGWVLFQQAKSELNAMMAEMHALQATVAELPKQIQDESERVQLELEKGEARLKALLDTIEDGVSGHGGKSENALPGEETDIRRKIYALTDSGIPAAEVAKRTGLSEGEVELVLGLREKEHQDR